MTHQTTKILLLPFLAFAISCAAPVPEPEDFANIESAEAALHKPSYPPAVPHGVKDNRSDPLFTRFAPEASTYVTRRGVAVPSPFMEYNVTQTTFTGTGDIGAAIALTRGTGYVPVEIVMPDGSMRASVQVFLSRMLDSSVGTYGELISWINVVSEGAPAEQRVLPYKNAYTTLVPLARGDTAFVLKLILDQRDALEVGREQAGLPKRYGKLSLPKSGRDTFKISERGGGEVLRGRFDHDFGAADVETMLKGLAEAFGIPELPPPAPEFLWNAVNWDVEAPSELVHWHAFIKALGVIQVPVDCAKDLVEFHNNGEVGSELVDVLDFQTELVGFGGDVMVVADFR